MKWTTTLLQTAASKASLASRTPYTRWKDTEAIRLNDSQNYSLSRTFHTAYPPKH